MFTRPDFDLLNPPPGQDPAARHQLEKLVAPFASDVDNIHKSLSSQLNRTGDHLRVARSQVSELGRSVAAAADAHAALDAEHRADNLSPDIEAADAVESNLSGAVGEVDLHVNPPPPPSDVDTSEEAREDRRDRERGRSEHLELA